MLQLVMKKKISEKAKVQSNRGIIILYRNTHTKKNQQQLRRSIETLIIGGGGGDRKVINKLTQFFCAIIYVDSVIEACA